MICPLLLGLGVGLSVGLKAGAWWGKTSTWLLINKGLNDDRAERKRNIRRCPNCGTVETRRA